MIAMLLACARGTLAPTPVVEGPAQLKLESARGTVAGLAVVVVTPERFVLQALTPAGVELFSASDEGVTAPDPSWVATLERLPFERDLRLIFAWECPEGACAVPAGGRVWQAEGLRHYRGPGGPARVELSPRKAVLRDPRRGYTLTIVGDVLGGDEGRSGEASGGAQ